MIRLIYKRNYDNPYELDGKKKENSFLGEFEVLQQISGDENEYSEQFIGKNIETKDIFFVEGVEVSGYNGGTRYNCIKLTFLCN